MLQNAMPGDFAGVHNLYSSRLRSTIRGVYRLDLLLLLVEHQRGLLT